MAKTKTLKKRKNLRKKSMALNGVQLLSHNPNAIFRKHVEIKRALAESLFDGDREAFVEILAGYVRSHNILEVCRRTGLSRTVVYESIGESGNPSLETLCKIMAAFDAAS